MRVLVLGALDVLGADARSVPMTSQQGRLVLALTVHLGEPLTCDRLVDAVWESGPPRDPEHALHTLISRIRKKFAIASPDHDPCLARRANGYVLDLDRWSVDALEFEDRFAAIRPLVLSRPDAASVELRSALALWRGDAYTDVTYSTFAQPEIRRLTELRLLACQAAISADIAVGLAEMVIPELLGLTAAFPLREPLWVLLLSALHASDRTTEVTSTVATMRASLGELGVAPSAGFEAFAHELAGSAIDPLGAAQRQGLSLF